MAANRTRNRESGQAVIETAFALPFIIWLLYYLINAFHTIHTSHVGNKFAEMSLYQRLDWRAKFAVDAVQDTAHGKEFMAVQYVDENGEVPRRKILLDTRGLAEIRSVAGICKEPGCN